MKKLIGLVAALACLTGGVWFVMRPTTLTIEVVLLENGTNVTDQVWFSVGIINDEAQGQELSLASLSTISPTEYLGTQFQVPADTEIGILVSARGIGSVSERISLPRGATDTFQVVLDAGMVNVTAIGMADAGQVRVRDVASQEMTGPEIKVGETIAFFFPAGVHEIEVKQGLASKRSRFNVIAGETQALDFEIGEGSLLLSLDTVIPWSDKMPDARIALVGLDRNALDEADSEGRVSFFRMPFDTYVATVELGVDGPRYVRSRGSEPVQIVVDKLETNANLPLPLHAVRLNLSNWEAADLEDADAMLLSMIDLGLPYAAGEVSDGEATLVFFPLAEDVITETFAVAIAQGNNILAIQEIGALVVDIPVDIVIEKGGDIALCAAVTEVANCDALVP